MKTDQDLLVDKEQTVNFRNERWPDEIRVESPSGSTTIDRIYRRTKCMGTVCSCALEMCTRIMNPIRIFFYVRMLHAYSSTFFSNIPKKPLLQQVQDPIITSSRQVLDMKTCPNSCSSRFQLFGRKFSRERKCSSGNNAGLKRDDKITFTTSSRSLCRSLNTTTTSSSKSLTTRVFH